MILQNTQHFLNLNLLGSSCALKSLNNCLSPYETYDTLRLAELNSSWGYEEAFWDYLFVNKCLSFWWASHHTHLSLASSTATLKPSAATSYLTMSYLSSPLSLQTTSTFTSFFTHRFINQPTIILSVLPPVLCCNRKKGRGNTRRTPTITGNRILYIHITLWLKISAENMYFFNCLLLCTQTHTHAHTQWIPLASQKQ